jgi:NitT/TauT family transport system substrate-binding protein
MKRIASLTLLVTIIVLTFGPIRTHAEQTEITIAKQYGLTYLQMMIMEDRQMVEKHARALGLSVNKVNWVTFRSSDVMNDALLSGSVDFVCLGPPGIAVIWSKTNGQVKAASGLNFLPNQLNTRSPNIKGIRDFTEKDKIAVPAVKVSLQAVLLQMWAAKEFGDANVNRLDSLTVSMTHPDAMLALLSGGGEINNHFASVPFAQNEMEKPGIRKVINATEILGGPLSANVVAASTKFQQNNPKTYAAFMAALQEATDFINRDKRAAAEIYIKATKDKAGVDGILKIMNDPTIEYSLVPGNIMKVVDFMYKVGSIKTKPSSWKDMFFPNAHTMPGS